MFTQTRKTTIYKQMNHLTHLLLFCCIFALMLCFGKTTLAANDDPGAGRLSGTDIPVEFYENIPAEEPAISSNLRRLGDTQTQSPYTNKTYTHRSDYADRSITHGIDVSEYQTVIDWPKVKAAGINFAFIRVGYRGTSSGSLWEDQYFRQNIQNALAAGVEVGVYIFSQAITEKEAQEEANYLLERIQGYNITFPVVLDYEFSGNPGRLKEANLSKKKATNVCLAFCETIQAAGYTPMVYANPDMLNNYLNADDISSKYLVWLANYTEKTTYTGKYDYWQYASTGSVDGIKGNVDMNFFYGTDIANASIATIPDQVYAGQNVTPATTITYKDKILTNGTDYTVTYSNNNSIGTAEITITGKNTFYGKQTLTFKIMPGQMTAVKAKKCSTNSITLSWKKDSSVTGYQIFQSTAIDGKYKKIATISKNTTKTYQHKNLTEGQCYYYKIRSYKTVNGKKWFGAFSEIKSICTKISYTRNALAKKNAILYSTTAISDTPLVVLAKNDTMTVSYATKDSAGNSWYYVTCTKDGQTYTGFVQSQKVTITKVGKITKNDVNVRKSNNTSSKVLTRLNKNKKVTILKTKKKNGVTWYQVTFKKKKKTYKGWISAPYVKVV